MFKSVIAAGLALATLTSCAATSVAQSASSKATAYKYELTPRSAYECTIAHAYAQELKEASDPEGAAKHQAMWAAWLEVINLDREIGVPISDMDAWDVALDKKLERKGSKVELERVVESLKPCEVMSKLYSGMYREGVRLAKEKRPELFEGDGAFARQIGGEYPDAPEKELMFDEWFFFARGNLCFAASTKQENGQLTLGFINFFDGSLRLEGDNLPVLTEDNYEAEMPKHQLGIAWSDEEDVFLPVLDKGVTYDSFRGTAIFIDETPIAMLNGDYLSMGQKYIFGAHVQRPYFNLMPVGQELRVKVLGKETHRMPINPSLWNEIAECMAQYPFG